MKDPDTKKKKFMGQPLWVWLLAFAILCANVFAIIALGGVAWLQFKMRQP
jgi:predicted membrane metal-binding protein